MPGEDSRSNGRKVLVGVLLIAAVTIAAVFAFRSYQQAPEPRAERPLPVARPRPSTPAPPPQLAPPPALTRAGLVAAAAAAASTYAGGPEPAADARPLIGRRFRVVLPFGCDGPREPGTEPSAWWEYGPERRTIRISVRPEIWTESAIARDLGGADVEAVEGFWIPRPWLASDACPTPRTDPLAAATPAPSPQTVGLATLFEEGGSRIVRRGDRPYEVVLNAPDDEPMPAPQGYRLVLEGRVVGFEGGEPIACRSASADQRPVCLVGVEIDRVAIRDPANAAVLGEWRS